MRIEMHARVRASCAFGAVTVPSCNRRLRNRSTRHFPITPPLLDLTHRPRIDGPDDKPFCPYGDWPVSQPLDSVQTQHSRSFSVLRSRGITNLIIRDGLRLERTARPTQAVYRRANSKLHRNGNCPRRSVRPSFSAASSICVRDKSFETGASENPINFTHVSLSSVQHSDGEYRIALPRKSIR
jgi:hypothetical protein